MKCMRGWLILMALMALGAHSAGVIAQTRTPLSSAGFDACRLDNTLPSAAVVAARNAWKMASRDYPNAPKEVDINPLGATNRMPIFFVWDALQGSEQCARQRPEVGDGSMRTFDRQTVAGLCHSRGGAILCSADAIRAMLDVERNVSQGLSTSPSLTFLFSHEFGHFLLGHPGAFTEGVTAIKFSANRSENISGFTQSCEQDSEQIRREEAADKFAFDVAKRLFAAAPYRPTGASVIESVLANSEIIYWTGKEFSGWAARYYGAASGDPFPKAAKLCELVERKSGSIIIPVFGGSHPQPMNRLAGIVNQSGDYINSLLAEERQSLSNGKSAFIGMNRLTDTILARAFAAAAGQFCERVSSIENGSLDCTHPPVDSGPGESLDIDLGGPRAPSVKLPLAFKRQSPYREVTSASPWVLVFSLGSYNSAPTQELALIEARKMVSVYGTFLNQVDSHLKALGGYWVREQHTSVDTSFNSFSNDYTTSVKAWGIVRLPDQLGPNGLPALAEMARWGRVDDVFFQPWDKSGHEVVIHFFRPGTQSNSADSQRVITRKLKFEEIFDLTAAREQQAERPAQLFRDLLPFIYTRLKAKFGGDYTLDTGSENDVFYITSAQMGDNFYLPKSWLPLIASTHARATSDDTLAKAVNRIYINNQTEQNVKAIFEEK